MTEIKRWADDAMYDAEPMETEEGSGISPKVYLLWMTPDPLGAIAAMSSIYSGKVVRSLTELTDEDRKYHWEQVQKTHLEAPLESVKFHFLIEGVDRGFTHQLVRQRTAVYAQESLRFAVKGNLQEEVVVPPHIAALKDDDPRAVVWRKTVTAIQEGYQGLINAGVPAEDARGLLPTATATRIHYITDLRGLKQHAGNRLCTQAQFHWRLVFAQIVDAIRNYGHQLMEEDFSRQTGQHPNDIPIQPGDPEYDKAWRKLKGWQFETIANSMIFRPVCFYLNKCPFKADYDRHCNIRDRVEKFTENAVPSTEWEDQSRVFGNVIHPHEWLADPDAAIRRKE